MRARHICIATLCAVSAFAADKGPPKGEAANSKLRIEATLYMDKAAVDKIVGQEMEDNFVVLQVRVTPVGDEKVNVYLDDFLLRSDKDGQTSTPYSPHQIAGASVLTVNTVYRGGVVGSESTGPVWGPPGGGRPSRLPVPNSGGMNTVGGARTKEEAEGNVESAGETSDSPLLAALKEKILPEKEIDAPIAGQLYFLMDGKHKVKQLELYYRGKPGKLSVRFKEQ